MKYVNLVKAVHIESVQQFHARYGSHKGRAVFPAKYNVFKLRR